MNSISINNYNCSINREIDELPIMYNFKDAIPYYDEKSQKLYCRMRNDKNNKDILMELNEMVTSQILIENANKLSQSKFMEEYIRNRIMFIEQYLFRHIYNYGFENPSTVQMLVVPHLIMRKDCLIQFKSGTGKTFAFLLGLLWNFDMKDKATQFIFLTYTHEIAKQIYEQVCEMLPETKAVLAIGTRRESGNGGFRDNKKNFQDDKTSVQEAQIIVGTTGKVYNYVCERKWVNTKYLKAICIDEFDPIITPSSKKNEMIMSTEQQIKKIIETIPPLSQKVFVSATISENATLAADRYFRQPDEIIGEPFVMLMKDSDVIVDAISQYYVECRNINDKFECLSDIMKQCRIMQSIIFANKIETSVEIKNYLDGCQIPSDIFHSQMSGDERSQVFNKFKNNQIKFLISTDVTSRGIDISSINVVFNFDMPDTPETYVHRIGRSGRYGKKGTSISFILVNTGMDEMNKIKKINSMSKHEVKSLPNDLANLL